MKYSGDMHRAIIESLVETCKQSLDDGPKAGFAVGNASEHTNGGYITIDTLIHCLVRVLTDERPGNQEDPELGPLFCGLVNFEESQHFNGTISNINPDLAHYCRLCLRNLNQKAYLLGVWDQQEYLPWFIIKIVMRIYSDRFKNHISLCDSDPYHSSERDMVLEGIVERVANGPSTCGEWLITASCSSMRVIWMNSILEEYFINTGDISDPSCPGWRVASLARYFTSEDICTWWANEMIDYIPPNRELWQDFERPQPPNHPPPSARRPVVVEPVNETKKKLTEILAFIEENRENWTMNDGAYLNISGLMKEAFDSV